MDPLVRLGYWQSDLAPDWPDPGQFVDPQWNDEERFVVTSYFAAGTVARAFMGKSPCRFCGRLNGSLEYTDGTYIWPEGLTHYLEEHSVRLPARVVEHAITRLEEVEHAEVNDSWWRSVRSF